MDSTESTEETKVLFIAGIPKSIPWKKIKTIITKHAEDNLMLQLIPQDSCNMLEITCSAKTCERLLEHLCEPLFMLNNNIRMYPVSLRISNQLENCFTTPNSILDINYDCLRKIFGYCTLKEQIVAAKVCRLFYETIRELWCGKSRRFVYNPYKMEFEQNLSNENIKDIFALLGTYVETLRYNTIFYFPMIQRYLTDLSGNMVDLSRKFVNVYLCRNLMYLENVKVFEVEGKFLTDFTIRELARYCNKLHTFRLIDTDVRSLKGHYFHLLPNLEHLYIRDCKFFSRRSLIRVCKVCNIKSLDITDCVLLQEPSFIKTICKLLPNLESFKLSAQINSDVLTFVLDLKNLKFLEFFWAGRDSVNFEVLLLKKLTELRANSLKSLNFVNDLIPIDNQSLQPVIDDKRYAELRERTIANGREWNLNNEFNEIMQLLSKLIYLKVIKFEYCRPFSNSNILKLQEACLNLKLLKLIGCSTEEDLITKNTWDNQNKSIMLEKICELQYEALVPAGQLELIKQFIRAAARSESHYSPTTRSIQCGFI